MTRQKLASKTIDFSSFSSIKIGPVCDVFLIDERDKYGDFYIIGGANNLLISLFHPKLAKLSKNFDFIKIENDLLHIGAATPSGKILSFCKKHDIKGFEFLGKLPGTLGGMLKMNAGVKQWEISKYLEAIVGANGVIEKEKLHFEYRSSNINEIIFEGRFRIESGFDKSVYQMCTKMRQNQPQLPSAGSCFKNPKGNFAGKLIESVGLKGKKIGDIGFSNMHANFLVNHGNGQFGDAIELIHLAKKRVYEEFGVMLQEEIQIV